MAKYSVLSSQLLKFHLIPTNTQTETHRTKQTTIMVTKFVLWWYAALVRRRAPGVDEKEKIKAEKKRGDPQSAPLLLKLNLDKPASLLLWKHYFFSSPGAVIVGSFASLYRNYAPLVFFSLPQRSAISESVFLRPLFPALLIKIYLPFLAIEIQDCNGR